MSYISEWENATIVQTREGQYGTVHICSNDLPNGDENNRRKKEFNRFVFQAIRNQCKYEQTIEIKK